jgi:hypothetical protein
MFNFLNSKFSRFLKPAFYFIIMGSILTPIQAMKEEQPQPKKSRHKRGNLVFDGTENICLNMNNKNNNLKEIVNLENKDNKPLFETPKLDPNPNSEKKE